MLSNFFLKKKVIIFCQMVPRQGKSPRATSETNMLLLRCASSEKQTYQKEKTLETTDRFVFSHEIDEVKALTFYQTLSYAVVHLRDIPAVSKARVVVHDQTMLYERPSKVTQNDPAIFLFFSDVHRCFSSHARTGTGYHVASVLNSSKKSNKTNKHTTQCKGNVFLHMWINSSRVGRRTFGIRAKEAQVDKVGKRKDQR